MMLALSLKPWAAQSYIADCKIADCKIRAENIVRFPLTLSIKKLGEPLMINVLQLALYP